MAVRHTDNKNWLIVRLNRQTLLGSDGLCTVGLTGIAAQPLRATAVEEAIGAGADLGESLDAVGLMSLDADAGHRRQLAIVAVERALDAARRRAAES